jgi:hypothetical protein
VKELLPMFRGSLSRGRSLVLFAIALLFGTTEAGLTPDSMQAAPLPGTASSDPGRNLALGRPAAASSLEGAGTEAALAVDGRLDTRWSSAWSDPQWIAIDLGTAAAVSRVRLNWESAYARSYQIQVSPDNSTWTVAYETTSADGGVDDIAVQASGRYVRMFGTARAVAYGYSLWEFEIYGTIPPS